MVTIRANFEERCVVLAGAEPWVTSPTPGVERMMLDRIGDEVARATSVVRFAPNTVFPEHVHGGGEEFLVLQGLFVDEDGEYGPGDYVRNPVGSRHAPRAGRDGATLFVKLHQFALGDTRRLAVQTAVAPWLPGSVPGLSVLPLHEFGEEHTALVRWAPNTQFLRHSHWGGEEILVLDGVFRDEHGSYPAGSWLRSPHLSVHTPFTAAEGATIFVKVGHLAPGRVQLLGVGGDTSAATCSTTRASPKSDRPT
jgi:anti-sigma factor ChrR (cupin superfamily)